MFVKKKKYPYFYFEYFCPLIWNSWSPTLAGHRYLKHCDDGPEQRVKVLAVGDGVAALRPQAELAAKQMHTQNAAEEEDVAGQWVLVLTVM